MITPSFGLTATERVLPKLALDFTTALLDSRVTFTRTTGPSNPATYINSSGVIVSATDNQPRFDYNNVTLACKGLLIEESRSNTLTYSIPDAGTPTGWSTGFNTGTWTRTLVSGFGVLSGFQNVIRHEQTVSGRSYLVKTLSLAASTTYCVSVYVDVANTTTNNPILSINNFTGASSFDGFSKTKADVDATGRVRVIFTTAADITGEVRLGLGIGGDETGVAVYGGWQLEAGAFVTSYIPTTSAALTRNADVAVMTGTNFSDWYNQSQGAFIYQIIKNGSAIIDISATDGTTSNTLGFESAANNDTEGFIKTAGATQANPYSAAGSLTLNTVNKIGLLYANNYVYGAKNGVALTTANPDTSATIPTVDQLQIGKLGTNNRQGFYLQKLFYYPQRVTNSELLAFTK